MIPVDTFPNIAPVNGNALHALEERGRGKSEGRGMKETVGRDNLPDVACVHVHTPSLGTHSGRRLLIRGTVDIPADNGGASLCECERKQAT